ncbi:MAG TPA: hypothetical protein ENJ33_05545 [Thiothrix sp.]|nr:hypothetical protein [Thiothrix sp.]
MKYKIIATAFLYSYLLLFTACNVSNQNQIAEGSGGGIGGTGIAIGRINAFGSIIVNGIEFNTDNATFIRDNRTVSSQTAYAVGERISITGLIDSVSNTGTAYKVVFSNLIEGPVTSKPALLSTNIEVMGQTIHTNNLTVLHGFSLLSDVALADILEVSGFIDANGIIQASSITLKKQAPHAFEIKGKISNLDLSKQTFTINTLQIDFSNAPINTSSGQLAEGQTVVITGQTFFNNTLFAITVTEEVINTLPSGTKIEVEGIITRFASATDFDLNGRPIIITTDTIFKDGAINALKLNAAIEVEGISNANGILVADSIELEQTENLLKIEALIESIDYENKTLVLFGQTIQVDQSTILFDESIQDVKQLNLNQFTVGEYIDAKFQEDNDGNFLAIRLNRENEEKLTGTNITKIGFKGTVHNINETAGSLTLFGIQMLTNENTVYRNEQEQPIDKAILFAAIEEDVTLVEIEGEAVGNNTILIHSLLVDLTL